MLILKALQHDPRHGLGIADRIQQMLRTFCVSSKDRFIPPFTGWKLKGGSRRNGACLITIVKPAITN